MFTDADNPSTSSCPDFLGMAEFREMRMETERVLESYGGSDNMNVGIYPTRDVDEFVDLRTVEPGTFCNFSNLAKNIETSFVKKVMLPSL